jgi:hypothetical protein
MLSDLDGNIFQHGKVAEKVMGYIEGNRFDKTIFFQREYFPDFLIDRSVIDGLCNIVMLRSFIKIEVEPGINFIFRPDPVLFPEHTVVSVKDHIDQPDAVSGLKAHGSAEKSQISMKSLTYVLLPGKLTSREKIRKDAGAS